MYKELEKVKNISKKAFISLLKLINAIIAKDQTAKIQRQLKNGYQIRVFYLKSLTKDQILANYFQLL